MQGRTFRRLEKKYLITEAQMEEILRRAGRKLRPDAYFNSTVLSLYYDTKNSDLIIHNIEKPAFKYKIRVRCYNLPKPDELVFIECKTKLKEKREKYSAKRRIAVRYEDFKLHLETQNTLVEMLEQAKCERRQDFEIAKQLDYIIAHHKLRPAILIAVDRYAYTGKPSRKTTESVGKDGFRITFDKELRYRTKKLNFATNTTGQPYFSDKHNIIMEVKTLDSMPLWFVKILSELKIYPQSFSKYGKIHQQLKEKQNAK